MTPPSPTPEAQDESTAPGDRGREEFPAPASGCGPEADPEVVRLLEGYLEQLEQGSPPRPEEWLAKHADLSEPLGECLATLELLHRAALGLGRGFPFEAARAAQGAALGQLGDYRLVREVGHGGMGVVYAAEQLSRGRRVALKVLPLAGALDARQVQRFHNEALAASQLHHPHIVEVLDAGCERGVHYYVMRFIEGETLAQLIARMRARSGPEPTDRLEDDPPGAGSRPTSSEAAGQDGGLPAAPSGTGPLMTVGCPRCPGYCRAAAEVGAQVAEALDYAHQHGIVHRDVKPSNVMLDTQGQAWVTDFGLAHLPRQAHLTQSGDLLGTLRYMSPEQALARRSVLDHRTDIYALGATLYELLTLRPAVPGEERQEILRRIAQEDPARPSLLNPAVPPPLEAVVLKAMAHAPEERYGTAQELAEDLRRFVDGQPVQARLPTRLQQAGKWARRHYRGLLAAGLAATLLLTLAVVLLALGNVSLRLRVQQEQTRAAEREKTLQLAMARWNKARMIRQARAPGQRSRSLEALAEAVRHLRSLGRLKAYRLELRNDAIASLTLWDVHPVQHFSSAPGHPHLCLDSLGRHYAAADGPTAVSWRRQVDDRVVRRWQLEGLACDFLDVSPDGRYLAAFCHDDRAKGVCRVWDTVTGSPVLQRPIRGVAHAFRPDGKVLALEQADRSVALCELGTGHDLPPLPARPRPDRLRFHPGGRYLAVSYRVPPEIEVWDLATRKMIPLPSTPYRAASLAWSPDGSLLALGSADSNIYVCAFPGGKVQAVLRGHENAVTWVEFHPSGRLLASGSHDETTRLWCFSPGGELVLRGEQLDGSFSRDGRRLATWSRQGGVTVWEVEEPGGCLHDLPHGQGPERGTWGITFSPDGRLLACASRDGALLWDAAAARRVGDVPSGGGHALAFSSDSHQLFTTGPGGVMEWPIVPEHDGRALRVGLGTVLRATTADSRSLRIDVAGTGESLLVGTGDGGVDLVPLAGPGRARRLGMHDGLIGVALSPDGRWAATVGDPDETVRVWDAARDAVVWRLPHGPDSWCEVTFSPDGRWLVIGTRSELGFWEVGSWDRKARLPRPARSLRSSVAFSRDGRLLGVIEGLDRIGLYDAASPLRHLATLDIPGPVSLSGLSLSPDGTRLAASTEQGVIALWDLRRLRQGLAALGLDWEMPPYPAAEPHDKPAVALGVEVLPVGGAPR